MGLVLSHGIQCRSKVVMPDENGWLALCRAKALHLASKEHS
jgi:hypothetical protein